MDPLRRDDLDRARRTPPEVRAAQALEMMRTGIGLKRAALRELFPQADDDEIDRMLREWLVRGS